MLKIQYNLNILQWPIDIIDMIILSFKDFTAIRNQGKVTIFFSPELIPIAPDNMVGYKTYPDN